MRKYENFQTEDFLMDDYFVEWMMRPSAEAFRFWEDFKTRNPSQAEELEKAVRLYRALQLNNDSLTAAETKILKDKIREQIRDAGSGTRRAFFLAPLMKVAAAIALVVVAGISIYQYAFNSIVLIETAYGERREITLPDASVISLNGNTSVRYASDFMKEVREVWLDGEAFFVVAESKERKFIVHTDDLDVEVLGTTFNVDNRESITKVVLNTGSITVHLSADHAPEKVLLSPGEMIEYKRSVGEIVKQVVDPALYASWKNDTLDFDRVAVEDIAERFEERYGYEITIADEALRKKFFTGRFSSRDIEVVILAMEKALGMEVVYEGKMKMIWKLS